MPSHFGACSVEMQEVAWQQLAGTHWESVSHSEFRLGELLVMKNLSAMAETKSKAIIIKIASCPFFNIKQLVM